MYHECTGFDASKVLPSPLMAREANADALKLRVDLNLQSSRVLLLGFGGHSVEWELEDHSLPAGWVCLVLGAKPSDMPSSRFIAMDSSSYVPNLIYISDAVLGKLGFGFVSECIINNTPLIYVPRSGWPEESYLEQYITSNSDHSALKMPVADFVNGSWGNYLDIAYQYKQLLKANQLQDENAVDVIRTDAALQWIGDKILQH